jgi:hypothetical protein
MSVFNPFPFFTMLFMKHWAFVNRSNLAILAFVLSIQKTALACALSGLSEDKSSKRVSMNNSTLIEEKGIAKIRQLQYVTGVYDILNYSTIQPIHNFRKEKFYEKSSLDHDTCILIVFFVCRHRIGRNHPG